MSAALTGARRAMVERQLNDIMNAPVFQRREAAWSGLDWLVES